MKKFCLSVDMVPLSMWGCNVRAVVSKETWKELQVFFRSVSWVLGEYHSLIYPPNNREARLLQCAGCNKNISDLELHEVWEFDDQRLIQKLVNLVPLCRNCHLSVHLGRANQLGLKDVALNHLAAVNKWTAAQLAKHVEESSDSWLRRSKHTYALDLSWLHQFIPESKIHISWLAHSNDKADDWMTAVIWARNILNSDSIIVDTETTGLLNYENVEIVEIAAIDMHGEVLINSRVKPRYKIPNDAIKIHGISNEDVINSPTFLSIWPEVNGVLNGKKVIAYNAPFDSEIIRRTSLMYGCVPPSNNWECAMRVYQAFQGGSWVKLPGGAHNALDDCRAVLNLIKHMATGKALMQSEGVSKKENKYSSNSKIGRAIENVREATDYHEDLDTSIISHDNSRKKYLSNPRVGQLVEHQKFGKGIVLSVSKVEEARVVIDFESAGKKELMLALAKLTPVRLRKANH